jgi:septal ring factor EnvC (AmiA/AmiB activator)
MLCAVLGAGQAAGPAPAGDPASGAEGEQAKQAELQTVRERMESVRARMEDSRTTRDDLQLQLRALELQVAALAGELRRVEEALASGQRRLERLAAERTAHGQALRVQREALARQVRADFTAGRRDYLAVLLSQEDPSTVARAMTYHRYFNQARSERIHGVQAQLAALDRVELELRREEEALRALKAEKDRAQAGLAGERQARTALLERIESEMRTAGKELRLLEDDARRLEKVLEALRTPPPEAVETVPAGPPFPDLKGALPWPAGGPIRHAFGAPRGSSGLAWSGVVIGARAGSEVRAVHPGRVAFADWLRGFGLLVILDHGDGYMTLYGHNEGLLKQVGDWVAAGEPVALVGDSGGQSEAGLYFEVRRRGTPLNPSQWCRGAPSGAAS